jgi:DNA-binding transcriptional MerR regulator
MDKKYLRTSDIAKAVGVHPNTVRLYEEWGYLPDVPRSPSGYRLFTEVHLDQMRMARTALQYPYPGGKDLVIDMVQKAAAGDLGGALELAYTDLGRIRAERQKAIAVAELLERWAAGAATDATPKPLRIGETADLLGLTTDTLRNWERNGLINVPHSPKNHYRQYGAREIGRLRVIRMLRMAGYSVMAILRMLRRLDQGQTTNLAEVLDSPDPGEDVLFVADCWLSTLAKKEQNALDVIAQLERMIGKRRR